MSMKAKATRMVADFLHGRPRARAKSVDIDPAQGGWNAIIGTVADRGDDRWTRYTDAEREAAYNEHSLVRACVAEIATSLPEPPLTIGTVDRDGQWQPKPGGHAALDLWNTPNKDYSANDVLQYMASRLLLTGKTYVWKWRTRAGARAGELWPVPTSWVTPVKGEAEDGSSRLVKGFRLWQGHGRERTVAPRDMVYARLVDPTSTHDGVGPLQAAAHDYQLDRERENYLAEMLDHLDLPGLVIETEADMSPEERRLLRQAIVDQVGRGARGKALLLTKAKGHIEAPLKDLDWPGFTGLAESRICAAFGVPPIIVGIRIGLDRSTFSNYGEARRSFYTETLVPLWGALEDVLTRCLLRHEGERQLEFRFDLAGIRELAEDAKETADRAVRLFTGSVATRNEARKLAGLPSVAGGDVFAVPLGVSIETAGGA